MLGMNTKLLIPTLAAFLMTSTVHATVAVYPQLDLAGYAPLSEAILFGAAGTNNPIVHQGAEARLSAFHDHIVPFKQAPMLDGSPLEACRNYQMEQLGIALSEDRSPLKEYLADYTKTFGGKVQLATMVQLNASSDMSVINTLGAVHPELDVVENGRDGVGLNFTPVVETYQTLLNPTPQVSCKILSAQEITVVAGSQLAILKAKHLPKISKEEKKLKGPDAFKMKDLVSVVSSTLQTAPKYGYPAHMDLQIEKIASDGTPKLEDVTPSSSQPSAPTAVAAGAN
jgi:hypothetical protein